jgi:IclR family pca regulon transcriptional regulator
MRKKLAESPGAAVVDSKNFVASLQKGLEVLTCFGRQHSRLTVSEVARLTGCSPASARRTCDRWSSSSPRKGAARSRT